ALRADWRRSWRGASERFRSWRHASGVASRSLRGSAGRAASAFVVAVFALGVPAALAATSANTSPEGQAATQGVSLVGNQFHLNGRPFVPHGFTSISQLLSPWCATNATAAASANYGDTEIATAINTWHANTLRFQVSQPVLAGPNGAAYAQQVQTNVQEALNAGLVVIISMQDQSFACGPAEPLPSQETEAAWSTLLTNTTLRS